MEVLKKVQIWDKLKLNNDNNNNDIDIQKRLNYQIDSDG